MAFSISTSTMVQARLSNSLLSDSRQFLPKSAKNVFAAKSVRSFSRFETRCLHPEFFDDEWLPLADQHDFTKTNYSLTAFPGNFGKDSKFDEDSQKILEKESIPEKSEGLRPMGRDEAWGLVMQAVTGTGWVTASGLEGSGGEKTGEYKWPDFSFHSKSPRRRMGVEFTCNKCNTRTRRTINPLAYTDGTVFVQCNGCEVFHKLVDNLGLFHELDGAVFNGSVKNEDFVYHQPYDPLFVGSDGE